MAQAALRHAVHGAGDGEGGTRLGPSGEGVEVDGERVEDRELALVPGTVAVLQVGKRKFAKVTLA